jgi:hypothetical protein
MKEEKGGLRLGFNNKAPRIVEGKTNHRFSEAVFNSDFPMLNAELIYE